MGHKIIENVYVLVKVIRSIGMYISASGNDMGHNMIENVYVLVEVIRSIGMYISTSANGSLSRWKSMCDGENEMGRKVGEIYIEAG